MHGAIRSSGTLPTDSPFLRLPKTPLLLQQISVCLPDDHAPTHHHHPWHPFLRLLLEHIRATPTFSLYLCVELTFIINKVVSDGIRWTLVTGSASSLIEFHRFKRDVLACYSFVQVPSNLFNQFPLIIPRTKRTHEYFSSQYILTIQLSHRIWTFHNCHSTTKWVFMPLEGIQVAASKMYSSRCSITYAHLKKVSSIIIISRLQQVYWKLTKGYLILIRRNLTRETSFISLTPFRLIVCQDHFIDNEEASFALSDSWRTIWTREKLFAES